jgi:hypothetical protein
MKTNDQYRVVPLKNKLFGGFRLKMEKEIATLMAVTLASVPREGS